MSEDVPEPRDTGLPNVDALGRPIPEHGELRVWLDDDIKSRNRRASEDWVQVQTAAGAIKLIEVRTVVELTLDHDLGDDEAYGKGIHVLDYIAEQQETRGLLLWPRDGITLHSANPESRKQMGRLIERYAGKALDVKQSIKAGHLAYSFTPRRAPDPANPSAGQ